MADDGVVRISTQVDVSSLRSGMEQAASAVQSSSQSMASAMEQATAASQRLAEAQAQLGSRATWDAEAASVLKQYQTELTSAQAAVEALAASETQETAIVRSSISARMAASAELRVLEGNMMGSTRAAGAFLSTLPGIGSAMQVAFPIFGAAALVEILTSMGEKAYEVYQKYISLDAAAKQFEETVQSLRDRNIVDVESIEDANLRVQQLNTSARDLLKTAQDIQSGGLFKALAGGFSAGGAVGAGAAIGTFVAARQAADEAYKRKLEANTIDLKTIELSHQIANAQIEAAHAGDSALAPLQRINAEEEKRLALIREQQSYNRARDEAQGNPVASDSGNQMADIQEQAARSAAAAQRSTLGAQEAAKQKQEQQKMATEEAREAIERLRQSTAELQKDTTDAMENMTARAQEYYRSVQDGSREEDRAAKADLAAYKEKAEILGRLAQQASDFAEQNYRQQGADIDNQQSTGQLSRLAADQERAAAEADYYRQKLDALKNEMSQLVQFTEEYNRAQRELNATQAQANLAATVNQGKIQQDIAQPWLNAFQQINQGWLQVQNQMLFTTRNIGLDFAKMGQNLVIWGLDSAEKWALQWIEKELLMQLFHQTTSAQWLANEQAKNLSAGLSTQQLYLTQTIGAQTAATATETANATATVSTQTANATAAASTQSTAVQQATAHAGVAAAGAASSQSSIPWIGPALAIAAGAAMFAEVLSMAHLDAGTGYVPMDGVAMLHQGEIVVPAPTADELRNGGAGGDGLTINQHNNFHGFNPDKEFKRQLYRNAAHVAGAVQRHLRQSGKG